jgi:hypothetical protein
MKKREGLVGGKKEKEREKEERLTFFIIPSCRR